MGRFTSVLTPQMDFTVAVALARAEKVFGDKLDIMSNAGILLQYATNPDVSAGGAHITVWDLNQDETYVNDNLIDTISSSDAGDSGLIVIQGHTITGSGPSATFTAVTQTVILDGQNKVTLDTPLARSDVMSGIIEGTSFAGTVYLYEDTAIVGGVPTDTTKIHCSINGPAGDIVSRKSSVTVSDDEYIILTGIDLSVSRSQNAVADFRIEGRRQGEEFRPFFVYTAGQNGGTVTIEPNPALLVPRNFDARVTADASVNNSEVYVTLRGYRANVIGTGLN